MLRRHLTEASIGRRSTVLISGEPGVGKTRLAEEITEAARASGARSFWGQCYEWEGAPAYWPWTQLLRGVMNVDDRGTLRSLLGNHAQHLVQVLPELGEVFPDLEPLPATDPEQSRFLLFDGMARVLGALSAERPLLIVLDDLHWADIPSLRLLQYVVQSSRDAHMLVLGTYRDPDASQHDQLLAILTDLARESGTVRLTLQGLTEDDVRTYVTTVTGRVPSGARTSELYRQTEGNPFFLTEIVRLLGADDAPAHASVTLQPHPVLPDSVRAFLRQRLHHLSAESRDVLMAASVIGRGRRRWRF